MLFLHPDTTFSGFSSHPLEYLLIPPTELWEKLDCIAVQGLISFTTKGLMISFHH